MYHNTHVQESLAVAEGSHLTMSVEDHRCPVMHLSVSYPLAALAGGLLLVWAVGAGALTLWAGAGLAAAINVS